MQDVLAEIRQKTKPSSGEPVRADLLQSPDEGMDLPGIGADPPRRCSHSFLKDARKENESRFLEALKGKDRNSRFGTRWYRASPVIRESSIARLPHVFLVIRRNKLQDRPASFSAMTPEARRKNKAVSVLSPAGQPVLPEKRHRLHAPRRSFQANLWGLTGRLLWSRKKRICVLWHARCSI
jgi:hypothetical protein